MKISKRHYTISLVLFFQKFSVVDILQQVCKFKLIHLNWESRQTNNKFAICLIFLLSFQWNQVFFFLEYALTHTLTFSLRFSFQNSFFICVWNWVIIIHTNISLDHNTTGKPTLIEEIRCVQIFNKHCARGFYHKSNKWIQMQISLVKISSNPLPTNSYWNTWERLQNETNFNTINCCLLSNESVNFSKKFFEKSHCDRMQVTNLFYYSY